MSQELANIYPILPTVYSEANSQVDVSAMCDSVARMRDKSPDAGVLITGSYGEFQLLTQDERVDICRQLKKTFPDLNVMAGAPTLNTHEAVALAARLEDAGADSIMVSRPFAAELSREDLLRHFEKVAEASKKPLVIYNNPVFGDDIDVGVLYEVIEKFGSYNSVKQGTRSMRNMVDSIAILQPRLNAKIFAASDLTAASAIAVGAWGATSTNWWVFPDLFNELLSPETDVARRSALTQSLQPYVESVRRNGQPLAVKAGMRYRGYQGANVARLPYAAATATQIKDIENAIREVDDFVGKNTP